MNLDGSGRATIQTGVGFFDHMLELLTKHAVIDLTVKATGDLQVDQHHTVEDVGICFGQAIRQALGNKAGIRRYGHFTLPMEETLVTTAIDLSGRYFLVFNATFPSPKIGDFDTSGAIAVLTFTIDDYAEAWVNGALPRRGGRPSPATIQGFNMPNRVVLAEQVKGGDKFQIAILGINGPISLAPPNPVFFREARIEFYK